MKARISASDVGGSTKLVKLIYQDETQWIKCRAGALHGCTELYCSEICRDSAFAAYHRALCVAGDENFDEPTIKSRQTTLERLFSLAKQHRRTNLLVIARMLANECLKVTRGGVNLLAAKREFNNFVWFNAVDGGDEEFATLLRQLCAYLFDDVSVAESIVNVERVRRLNGVLLRNASTVRPVSEAAIALAALSREARTAALQLLHSPQCTHVDNILECPAVQRLAVVGTGLYRALNVANHSCRPTAAMACNFADHRMTLIGNSTERRIAPGDELTISYCDETQPRDIRRAFLSKHYLFDCHCEICK